jgi:hypothetical protein
MEQATMTEGFSPNALHGFTRVMFELLPEIDFRKLHAISQLWSTQNRNDLFHDLQQSLQKAQWAKHSGLSALRVDATLASAFDPKRPVVDPVAHVVHEKNLVECIVYCKSALDSLARFFRLYLNFQISFKSCDFSKQQFISKFYDGGEKISSGVLIEPFSTWFESSRRDVYSIFPTRDKWIHNGIPNAFLVAPPMNGSIFQVPLALDGEPMHEYKYDSANYINTNTLVSYHVGKITQLLRRVINNVYRNERRIAPNIKFMIENEAVSFFPMVITEAMRVQGLKVGPMTAATYPAGE